MGSEYPLHRYDACSGLTENKTLLPSDFPVESYLDDFDRLFDLHEECGGDFIWSASIFWGIPWLEAIIGCSLYANHATGSIRSEPPLDFTGSDSIHDFDMDNPWIQKAVEFLEKMIERKRPWPIGTTRMRGITDLLSALYGSENFLFAMMEKPSEIKEVCQKLTDIWIKFGKLQLKYIPEFYGGIGSFYYNSWAPKGTIWLQEDAAALLSPELYSEFIKPFDLQIVDRFDSSIIHLHSTGFIPLDNYVKMGFKAIELHIDQGGPSAEQLYEKHLKIMEHNSLIIWGDISEEDMDWIFDKLPSAGLAINVVVKDPEQAETIWNRYTGKNFIS